MYALVSVMKILKSSLNIRNAAGALVVHRQFTTVVNDARGTLAIQPERVTVDVSSAIALLNKDNKR